MKGRKPLELVANGLKSIALPSLSRPAVKPNEARTQQLVEWGTRVYVYSVIAHIRTALSALSQLAQTENTPASFVLSRHVFEWAAHACYMSRNLKNYFQRKEWGRGWRVLTIAGIGNLWARQHGTQYAAPGEELPAGVPDPLTVSNLISAYEVYRSQQWRVKDAKDDYALLSEYSHPNSACLQQYHEWSANGRDLEFSNADSVSPLPFVNRCLIDLLTFIDALLELSRDTTVRPGIASLLEELAKLAAASRAWPPHLRPC